MITKNFKSLLATILHATAQNSVCLIPVKIYDGRTYYLYTSASQAFPSTVNFNVVFFSSSAGIIIGSGNTPETENDYALENIITSGLTASAPTKTHSVDSNGNPQTEYTFTLNNTTSSDIVIREIGYNQSLRAGATQLSTSSSTYTCLLDRTVLENPVTIPANGYAAIKYTLKTVLPS